MDSGRLIFDPVSCHAAGSGSGHMLRLGSVNPVFRAGSVLAVVEDTVAKIRPFFTAPDEYFEEEYYDEELPVKKRRLTPEQVHLLERSFESENKLEPERKSELAQKLGLKPRQVAVWFQNRRARWRTKNLERDFDGLKASYDSLLADHESLRKDNDRLRSQILSLTEKLKAKEQTVSGVTEVKLTDQVGSSSNLAALSCQPKSEDRVSSRSGGSAVVDGDGSGQSYFPETYNCAGPINGGVQSEEEDASDEGCSYDPEPIFAKPHQDDEDAQLEWWVWN